MNDRNSPGSNFNAVVGIIVVIIVAFLIYYFYFKATPTDQTIVAPPETQAMPASPSPAQTPTPNPETPTTPAQ